MKIENFILADEIEWLPEEKKFKGRNMVPPQIRLLNPSPQTEVTFCMGLCITGLQPGNNVTLTGELCFELVGKWITLGQQQATMGVTDTYWIVIDRVTFPPAREGAYKIRMTARSGGASARSVKRVAIRFTPAN